MLKPWLQGLAFMLTATSLQAAPIDLIIDTDPGADDVVALFLALASPEELNVRAITTVAGNVRLDKTSRNARLAREWAGREDIPVYAGAGRPLVRALSMPQKCTAKKAWPAFKCMSRRPRWPPATPCSTW